MGSAYQRATQYDSSLYYLTKAIHTGVKKHRAFAYYTLGRYYTETDQLPQAIENLEKALSLALQSKKNKRLHPNRIYYRLGEAHKLQQKYAAALAYYQKALVALKPDFTDSLDVYSNPNLQGRTYDDIHLLEALQVKAKIFSLLSDDSENLSASLSTYLLAIQWTDSLRQTYVLEDNELFWSERFKTLYSEAIHVSYQLFEKTGDSKYIETALALAEKSKAILLLEAFTTNTGRKNTSIPQAMLDKERDLSIDIAFYEKSYQEALQEQDTAKQLLFQNYLRDTRLALASWKEKMEREHPDYFKLKYQHQDLDIQQLQNAFLDEQTALVDFFIDKDIAYAFVLSKNQLQMVPLEHPDSLDQYLSRFMPVLFDTESFLEDPGLAFEGFNALSFQLYKSLLYNTLKTLPNTVNRLIIIPDEGLNVLPFEVLNTTLVEESSSNFAKLPYLFKDYQIRYGYSLQLLLKNQERHQQLSPNIACLAFAPTYAANETTTAMRDSKQYQTRDGVAQLEYTATEIENIDQYFDGQFVASAEATKARFIDQAADYGILHLAMHGEADFENTKFGHLIFSNADTNTLQQNLLYHYEIANLPLNAQLAVLSACETGRGKYTSGEGVFSIARSFMYAGVPSIVMSLWKVNDQSTSQILPTFYQKLADGMTKDKALQEAKLAFLTSADMEFRHPYYWASFVALGDQQPLRKPFPIKKLALGIGLLALGIGGYWGYAKSRSN